MIRTGRSGRRGGTGQPGPEKQRWSRVNRYELRVRRTTLSRLGQQWIAVYHRPYNPGEPPVCMDEQPVQLIREVCAPLPAAPGHAAREDYEYEHGGTANIFMFTEPLAGWRHAIVCRRETAVDWAQQMRWLLEEVYPVAERVVLVCDNLNTHSIGSFYVAFPPAVARRLVERLEIQYTPKHGSWLNIAETELSVMTRQCLSRRISDIEMLRREVDAWRSVRNQGQKGVDWQFSTTDARIRLRRLYPQIQS